MKIKKKETESFFYFWLPTGTYCKKSCNLETIVFEIWRNQPAIWIISLLIRQYYSRLSIDRELYNRVFRKVRKTQHQYPEFGPKSGEIEKKKPAKKNISLQGGETQKRTILFLFYFCGKPSFILFWPNSFLFPTTILTSTLVH
jgi:hypothetical protein